MLTTHTTTCTCRAPEDCCPACYRQRRTELESRLFEAQLSLARLQQEALALEQDFQSHRAEAAA